MELIGCLVPKLQSKCIADVEHDFERKRNVYTLILLCYVKFACIHVKRQLENQQRYLEKTSVMKVGGLNCVHCDKLIQCIIEVSESHCKSTISIHQSSKVFVDS